MKVHVMMVQVQTVDVQIGVNGVHVVKHVGQEKEEEHVWKKMLKTMLKTAIWVHVLNNG